MMLPVLFKLQRRSRTDDAAVVSCLKNKHLQNTGEESNLLAAHVRLRGAIKGLGGDVIIYRSIVFMAEIV